MGLRDNIRSLIRRRTPVPREPEIYNMGIQEKKLPHHYAGKYLYETAQNSTIVRTCLIQLKTEVFRRGYEWKKQFEYKCEDCGYEYQREVDQCSSCGSTNLRRPDFNQKTYAEKFFKGYVNDANQLFIDILREMETDLNVIDDAFLVLVKGYYLDKRGKIVLSKVNEVYRADPTTMYIETDEDGDRGHSRYICPTHRDFISEDKYDKCGVCNSCLYPVEFVNKTMQGEEQYFITGEVIHISK